MTEEELFVDRYGAVEMDSNTMLSENKAEEEISLNKGYLLVEIYDEDYAECLYKSIPIADILKKFEGEISYKKVNNLSNKLLEVYLVKELPCLLIFSDSNLVGKIEGYYSLEQKNDFFDKLKDIKK